MVIEHAVIKAAGRVMAVHRSWSRAKGANGEMTGNINDSSWFTCLCQPMDQGVGQQMLNRTYKDKNLCVKTNIYSFEK